MVVAACSDDDDDDTASTEAGADHNRAATEGTEPAADTTTGTPRRPGTTTGDTEATEGGEGGAPSGTVTNAQEQEFFAYNPNLSTTNAASNTVSC